MPGLLLPIRPANSRCVSRAEQEATVSLDMRVSYPSTHSSQARQLQFCDQIHWQRQASKWHWGPSHSDWVFQGPVGTDRFGCRATRQKAILEGP